MARQWTEEERRKQSEAIKRWKPWEKSTGPKTKTGKESSRMNAFKHGAYTIYNRDLEQAFRMQKLFVKGMVRWLAAEEALDALRERTNMREGTIKRSEENQRLRDENKKDSERTIMNEV